jgi:hypothetical protein
MNNRLEFILGALEEPQRQEDPLALAEVLHEEEQALRLEALIGSERAITAQEVRTALEGSIPVEGGEDVAIPREYLGQELARRAMGERSDHPLALAVTLHREYERVMIDAGKGHELAEELTAAAA